jgi:hypothetical protein
MLSDLIFSYTCLRKFISFHLSFSLITYFWRREDIYAKYYRDVQITMLMGLKAYLPTENVTVLQTLLVATSFK